MPLYDYRCEAGHKYEIRLPFGSASEQPCEKCGKPAKRQLHARPIMFKGSGWYSTDSRGSSSTRTSRSSFVSDNDGGEGAKSSSDSSKKSSSESAKKSDSSSGSSSSSPSSSSSD